MAIKTVRVKINGAWVNLTRNSSTGKYEGTITAPAATSYNLSGGYYPVTVEATNDAGTVVTKDATDLTIGTSLRLIVKEIIRPVITLVQPSNGAYMPNNKTQVVFNVTDETGGSGVKTAAVALKIDSMTHGESSLGMVKTAITNGYKFTYTPQTAMPDGKHNIVVNAQDNDGNAANAVTAAYTIDTTPPSLTISYPPNGLVTNAENCVLRGITNDALSSPVAVTVKHGGITHTAAVESGGNFVQALALTEGTNTITVTSTDAAGKATVIVITAILDTTVPVVKTVTFEPNPINASASVLITLGVE